MKYFYAALYLKFFSELFHKVDKDKDGFVTDEELIEWMKYTQNKYFLDDAEKQMKQNDLDNNGYITWREYENATYGFMENGTVVLYKFILE